MLCISGEDNASAKLNQYRRRLRFGEVDFGNPTDSRGPIMPKTVLAFPICGPPILSQMTVIKPC